MSIYAVFFGFALLAQVSSTKAPVQTMFYAASASECPTGTLLRAPIAPESALTKLPDFEANRKPDPDMVPPRLVSKPELVYPKKLFHSFQPGLVVILARVDESGRVAKAEVMCSSDNFFEKNAIEFMNGVRFSPATLHGKTVPMTIQQQIKFTPQPPG